MNILKFGASVFDKVTRPFRAIIVAYNVPKTVYIRRLDYSLWVEADVFEWLDNELDSNYMIIEKVKITYGGKWLRVGEFIYFEKHEWGILRRDFIKDVNKYGAEFVEFGYKHKYTM